ncbi:Choline-phosphate cytidylyltransferase B [Termitomyces sp. J132]|nr:hypothetical protein H2248_010781 [Termitomyces sp. 'cryptogamus']KNZ74655.1 Choline-phosphate cytidylyltransferase B [Termitomyces sp. J132]
MDVSSVLSDDDYDVVSNPGQRSLESSTADFGHIPTQNVCEPPPSQIARDKFDSVSWTANDIQAYVRKVLGIATPTLLSSDTTKRVYIDGMFDGLNAGHALRLRQAKLSFPSVYLIVGVYSDDQLRSHGYDTFFPHVERCEVVRHCRWVDEVITDAPYVLNLDFIDRHRIDYVSLEEGTSVDPGCDKARLKGYDAMKDQKIVVPTRRTPGISSTFPVLPATCVSSEEPQTMQAEVYDIGPHAP